ncbi:hypothetical protein B0H19DRAFT_1139141 [Mycena capillaripes]|nr:hypothetical protein B0H19DRAFT_1139141 [Mycena capillaripes]
MSVQVGAQRVQELWFRDGNLVIQAGNSQYRVFGGILAARSPVFQDTLSLPQPPDSELIEGCPVVHLFDSPIEVTAFLRAIFEPEFYMPFPAKTDFDTVCGCLRLSHKYGMEYLRRRALVHLSSRHPTTLPDCDTMMTTPSMRSWERPDTQSYIIFLIQLVREVDAVWILPYAFYVLCHSFEAHLGSAIFRGASYNGIPASLSEADQDLFLRGYNIQKESTKNDILRFLFSPARIKGCADAMRCLQVRIEAFDSICQRNSEPGASSIPLHIWPTAEWSLLRKACPTCQANLKTRYQNARQAFWDELPEMYGSPPWDELEKMKTAALSAELPPSTRCA